MSLGIEKTTPLDHGFLPWNRAANEGGTLLTSPVYLQHLTTFLQHLTTFLTCCKAEFPKSAHGVNRNPWWLTSHTCRCSLTFHLQAKIGKKKCQIQYQLPEIIYVFFGHPTHSYVNLSICLGLWSVCGFRNAVRNWDKAHRRLVVYSKVNEAPVSGAWLENPRNRESIGIIWDPCLKNRTIQLWLVGGWATPLKNIKVSWDDPSQYVEK